MMKTQARLLLVGAGLLVPFSGLGAQTLPVPELSPSPGPPGEAPPADAEAIGPSEPLRSWDFALGAGLGWDDNIDFRTADGPSDVMLVPRAGVARVFRQRHGELRVAASGLWTGYRDHEDLRRYYADFGLDASHRSSPRTSWRASASYGIGDSASTRILREQGVALPRVKTRSAAGAAGVSRRLGRRNSLSVDGRFHGTDFDSPDLIDGSSARATVGLERAIGGRSTGGISYALEHVLSGQSEGSYLTHFAAVQWTRAVSRHAALLVQAGASSTPDAARAGLEHRESFFGGTSFTADVKRSSVTLFLRREVAPAFGTGDSRLDLRAGLRAAIALGRAWELGIDASHVRPQGPATGPAPGASYDGFTRLSRRLGGWVEVSGETRYRRLEAAGGLPAIQQLQAGVFLTLLTAPARGSSLFR